MAIRASKAQLFGKPVPPRNDLRLCPSVDCVWNVMAHAQKPDCVFRRNGRVHLYRRGRQFSRLLAAEVYASAVVMLATPSSEVVWRVLATLSIRQFPLHFYRASPFAITLQLGSTNETFPPPTPDTCARSKTNSPTCRLETNPTGKDEIPGGKFTSYYTNITRATYTD